MIGFVQLGMNGVMPLTRIGARNTVPSRIARIVPFGDFHISVKLYSFTRAAFGVMAHFTATPYFFVASAESIVT